MDYLYAVAAKEQILLLLLQLLKDGGSEDAILLSLDAMLTLLSSQAVQMQFSAQEGASPVLYAMRRNLGTSHY